MGPPSASFEPPARMSKRLPTAMHIRSTSPRVSSGRMPASASPTATSLFPCSPLQPVSIMGSKGDSDGRGGSSATGDGDDGDDGGGSGAGGGDGDGEGKEDGSIGGGGGNGDAAAVGGEENENDMRTSLRGLNWVQVAAYDEAADVMQKAGKNRSVASTNIHEHSSRCVRACVRRGLTAWWRWVGGWVGGRWLVHGQRRLCTATLFSSRPPCTLMLTGTTLSTTAARTSTLE
jgi:hypothetical protein